MMRTGIAIPRIHAVTVANHAEARITAVHATKTDGTVMTVTTVSSMTAYIA
jgi:hypothetical protein